MSREFLSPTVYRFHQGFYIFKGGVVFNFNIEYPAATQGMKPSGIHFNGGFYFFGSSSGNQILAVGMKIQGYFIAGAFFEQRRVGFKKTDLWPQPIDAQVY